MCGHFGPALVGKSKKMCEHFGVLSGSTHTNLKNHWSKGQNMIACPLVVLLIEMPNDVCTGSVINR